jgi:hypothetical protein
VISHKYGQVPEDPKRNPDNLSLTELEFLAARDLGRPVLLFIMGPGHDVTLGDVETDPAKRARLDAFRESAKRMSAESAVHRVYKVFNNLQEFEAAAIQSVAELRRHLDVPDNAGEEPPEPQERHDGIPPPPALYAEPPYIGSHRFVGRDAQLQTLNDWAACCRSALGAAVRGDRRRGQEHADVGVDDEAHHGRAQRLGAYRGLPPCLGQRQLRLAAPVSHPTRMSVGTSRARRAVRGLCTVVVFRAAPRETGNVTHPAGQNRGLNAHVSSAVRSTRSFRTPDPASNSLPPGRWQSLFGGRLRSGVRKEP